MSSDFKKQLFTTVSEAVVELGDAYDAGRYSDEFGMWDNEAELHFQTSCRIYDMEDFVEDFEWTETGYGQNVHHKGIRTLITCDCGKVNRKIFFVEDHTLSTLLIRWMTS